MCVADLKTGGFEQHPAGGQRLRIIWAEHDCCCRWYVSGLLQPGSCAIVLGPKLTRCGSNDTLNLVRLQDGADSKDTWWLDDHTKEMLERYMQRPAGADEKLMFTVRDGGPLRLTKEEVRCLFGASCMRHCKRLLQR